MSCADSSLCRLVWVYIQFVMSFELTICCKNISKSIIVPSQLLNRSCKSTKWNDDFQSQPNNTKEEDRRFRRKLSINRGNM